MLKLEKRNKKEKLDGYTELLRDIRSILQRALSRKKDPIGLIICQYKGREGVYYALEG